MQPACPPFKEIPFLSLPRRSHAIFSSMNTLRRVTLSLLLVLPMASPGSESVAPSKEAQWSVQVLMGSEFHQTRRGNTCRRWVFSPTLSAYTSDTAHQELAREIVTRLNTILSQTPIKGIRLLPRTITGPTSRSTSSPWKRFPACPGKPDLNPFLTISVSSGSTGIGTTN